MGGFWQVPELSRQSEIITFEGGHNVGAPPVSIGKNQSMEEWGWDITSAHPSLHTRRNRKLIGGSGSANPPRLLTDFQGTLIRAMGGALQRLNGSSWTNITTGLADTDWDYTHFEVSGDPAIILTNGTDPVKYWKGGSSSLANLSNDAPKGKFITNDTIRVWIAQGDVLHYSAFLSASDWTTPKNSGSVQYFTPRGGDITALTRFADRIIVFKSDAMSELHGTNYFEFRLMDVSNDIGCLNYKTVREVQGLLYWLGPGPDVYVYTGGIPRSIGNSIRKYLEGIDDVSACYAGTDGLNYFLGLKTLGDTYLLVYSPKHQIWRVFGKSLNYAHSHLMGNRWFLAEPGKVYEYILSGQGDDPPSEIKAEYVTKPFDAGMPQAEKEFYEAHLQGLLSPGSSVELYISRSNGPADDFELIDQITVNSEYHSQGFLIPLDRVPLCRWIRFKIKVVGYVQLYQMQVYYDILPVQQGGWIGHLGKGGE